MQESANSVEEYKRLLEDERERNRLKNNMYQDLKDEYTKLQEELTSIYEHLKEARSNNEFRKSSHQSEVRKLENKIQEQCRELNYLNEKIKLFESKELQSSVIDEATNYYESKIKELHSESDRIRDQYNNLHYENAILKCKYDSRESEFTRLLEKVKLDHLVEIDHLLNKIKTFEKEKSLPSDTYAVELKSTKREVLDLNTKIKVLLSECEELRAQNENLTLQMSGLMRSNAKQSADNTNNLRTLESEKIKIMRQLEVCEKELSNAQEHRKALNIELQTSSQKILSLQTKIEQTEHESQMTKANLQDEIARFKSEWESEEEGFTDEITRLSNELREIEEGSSDERHLLLAKEQELKKDLVTARQQYWKLSNEMQQEREKLERKIRELEVGRNGCTEQLNHDIQSLRQKLHACTVEKMELEKQIVEMKQHMKEALQNPSNYISEAPIPETLNYHRDIQDLKDKFELLAASWSKQREVIDHKSNSRNAQTERDHELLQMKLTWEQQKLHYQQRLEELESQLRECKNLSVADKREFEFKIKQYTNQISKLREKIESQKEKLQHQNDLLEKYVPAEVHLQVKSQLLDLQRRLEDYKRLISDEPPIKQSFSAHVMPSKMLTDIKNIDFRGFTQQESNKDITIPFESNKEVDKSILKKKHVSSRRRFSKTKERNSHLKSPVLTSSSDIDWENLGQ